MSEYSGSLNPGQYQIKMTIPEERQRPFVDSNLNEIQPPPYDELQTNNEDTERIDNTRGRSNSRTRRNQRIIRRLQQIEDRQIRLRERTNFILLGPLITLYNIFNNLTRDPQLLVVKCTSRAREHQTTYSLGNFSLLLIAIMALTLAFRLIA